ncbi:MAG: DinB family protein [Terracidiphilus sp.]
MAKTSNNQALREHLVKLLKGGDAHATFEQATQSFPTDLQGKRPKGAEHSPWEVLEHLRIAQWDILDFSRNPKYKEREWPKEYWPETQEPPSKSAWAKSVKAFQSDLQKICDLVSDPKTDLYAKIPHGNGQTILREALVVADHNAYHLGEMVLLKRQLGAWTPTVRQ